jgi:hypothetical protein
MVHTVNTYKQTCKNAHTVNTYKQKWNSDTSIFYLNIKGKAIPLQAWTGPEGSRSLRLPDFKTIGT